MNNTYGTLFNNRFKEGNFLQYDEANVVSTSMTYPHSDDYEYSSYIDYIDFDKECEADIASGNGFIVQPAGRNIKKDLKAEDGLFSPRFGQVISSLTDTSAVVKMEKKDSEDVSMQD